MIKISNTLGDNYGSTLNKVSFANIYLTFNYYFYRNSMSDDFCHHIHPGGVMIVVERT
jgi:hypothetical protein